MKTTRLPGSSETRAYYLVTVIDYRAQRGDGFMHGHPGKLRRVWVNVYASGLNRSRGTQPLHHGADGNHPLAIRV
jgi:hypothetical protein